MYRQLWNLINRVWSKGQVFEADAVKLSEQVTGNKACARWQDLDQLYGP